MTLLRSATLLGVACAAASAADISSTTAIVITGDPLPPAEPAADAGARLSARPGIDAVRMGGTGLDPVFRGQSGTRLRVETDGACPQGGCPNRMDPPTTYAPAGADAITVVPGTRDVRHAGAPVAVVSLERPTPRFDPGEAVRASADARYATQGDAREAGLDAAVGRPWGFARVAADAARADDYEDGDGTTVASRYRSLRGGGTLGWTPSDDARIEAAVDLTRERDAAFAGAKMDAPSSDGTVARLRGAAAGAGVVQQISASVWLSRVDHVMDNFSLRPLTAPMQMETVTCSEGMGADVAAELALGDGVLGLGLGLTAERQAQDALRWSGPSLAVLNAVVWPDAMIDRVGAYADVRRPTGAWTVYAGLRVDHVRSGADATARDPAGMLRSPDALYADYYGTEAGDRSEFLTGLVVGLDWRRGASEAGLRLSRQQRAADISERFIGMDGMFSPTTATRPDAWVGNPGLDPETHQAVELRWAWNEPGSIRFEADAWLDVIADAIRRDRARGQPGILVADRATIYRNGEARLWGWSAAAEVAVTPWCDVGADAHATWGEDGDSGEPLAQIPPWSGSIHVALHHDRTAESMIRVRWADDQDRVDDDMDSGAALDPGTSPGWAVLDWSAAWRPRPGSEIAVGIDNLFDRTYAEHLGKANALDPAMVRVHEPGRSLWVRGGWSF
ncbi:MAG: hypothetical protein RLZZ127_717 [Planctomycetota bacterium]|jgi:iron complex outermembrane receptor protein